MNKNNWIQTDGSLSTLQYGKKINHTTWDYAELGGLYNSIKEAEGNKSDWDINRIDFTKYSYSDIESNLKSYGYKIESYDDNEFDFIISQTGIIFNPEDSCQIICECISEINNNY